MRMRITGVTIQLSGCGNFDYLLWKEVSLAFEREKRGSVKELKLCDIKSSLKNEKTNS